MEPLGKHDGLILMGFLALLGCASASKSALDEEAVGGIKTRRLAFRCDRTINQGMMLPVDVIYITRYRMPREVIALGPELWFNSPQRERWEERQTLSLKGGETRELKLNKLWLRHAKLLIVYANFEGVLEPYPQQIIIDESGRGRERILVLPTSLVKDGADGEEETDSSLDCWFCRE